MVSTTSPSQQGEDANGGEVGWGPFSSTPPDRSLQQGSGGGGGAVDGSMGFMGNSSGDENLTTEDPHVRAFLKRAIVELYDTCHRLLSFRMLNYDAFVQLMDGNVLPLCQGSGDSGRSYAKMTGVGGGGGGGGAAGNHQ
ncbi:unnamed protein product, partial [Ectocarpus sp. 4 AP-2014]